MVFSPLRLTFSLSVLTRPRAGRVGVQRLRVAWVYPNEYSADAWSAPPRHTCGICAHREGIKRSIRNSSLDAKSILVLRHNSTLVLRRHSILRRQGGVKEKGTSPTCLFKAKSDTKVELAKLTTAVCGAPRDALAAPASVLTHPPSLVLYFRTQ